MAHRRIFVSLGLLAGLALLLPACQNRGLAGPGISGSPDGVAAAPRAPGTPSRAPTGRGGAVAVGAKDMAAVDAYFRAGRGGQNTRWILGDYVDVQASKEYFSTILSVNRGPFVSRSDTREGDDLIVTLKFLGNAAQASASNNPRVQLGTGLTVTAYKMLRVRLMKTRDARMPVRLHITARGQASRGHREEVIQRGNVLQMGGNLVYRNGAWTWSPI